MFIGEGRLKESGRLLEKMRYVERGLFEAFYEDSLEFKDYIRNVLDIKFIEVEVVATKQLQTSEIEAQICEQQEAKLKEKLDILNKEKEHLKCETVALKGNTNPSIR